MQLIDGNTGLFAPFAVYTVKPESLGSNAYALRLLGCAFPVQRGGVLATCNHLLNNLNTKKEALVVQHPTESICHHVKVVDRHPKHDFAVLHIEATINSVPTAIRGELPLAVSSFAYGYYDCTIEDGKLTIIPQVFSGTITATPTKFKLKLQTVFPFYQLSFPCLPGFSGSPLYSDIQQGYALSGMVFGNERSEIIERVVTEYDDGSGRVIEKVGRVFESGVAHTCDAIRGFCDDLNVKIWDS